MGRRRDDDDSGEYESPRERTTRIKGGFGMGFFGSIGCVCGLVFLFCILPIGFLVSGGCVAREAAHKVRERGQEAATDRANQKAANDAALAANEAERKRLKDEADAEVARLASPLKVGNAARVKAGDRPYVSTTPGGLDGLLTALVTKDELALSRIAAAGTSGRVDPLAKCKVLTVAGTHAKVIMDADGREWWILFSALEQVPKGK